MAPSSVISVGTFDSGLNSSSAGSVVPTFQRSTLLSMPRAMAQAVTLRTYGLAGEKASFMGSPGALI